MCRMTLLHRLFLWISSLWNAKNNADLFAMNYSKSYTTDYREMIRLQQEQIQLSKDIVDVLYKVKELLSETKVKQSEAVETCQTRKSSSSSNTIVQQPLKNIPSGKSQSSHSINDAKSHRKIRSMDINGTNDIELYTPGGNYHLMSSIHKIILPDKPRKKQCSWAILISSGPYSGSEVLMMIVAAWLELLQISFRGFAFWGFHAHSNMNVEDIQIWLNGFHTWLQSLGRGDIVILRTPFFQEDGNVARKLCQQSFIIQSLRSIQDMALLHKLAQIKIHSNETSPSTEKRTFEYLRQVLFHQKRWKEDANLTIHWDELNHLPNLIHTICQELVYKHLGLEDVCENPVLFNKVLKDNKALQMSYQRFLEEEELVQMIRSHLDDEDESFITHVQSSFHHWIYSDT
jgi:hypothetical protein